MAAADVERTRSCTRQSSARDSSLRTWLITYGGIWTLTLAGATIVTIGGRTLGVPVHQLLALRLSPDTNPQPDLGRVLALASHNIPIVSWPLLLGAIGAHRNDVGRRIADCLVAACVAANALPVGAALGAYGAALLPYVPQLPLEWGALAVGAGSWLQNRRRPVSFRESLGRFAVVVCVLLCAAAVETAAVPHR
jgi:hypothetical protein